MTKHYGKANVVTGLWVMAFFMIYGFLLIYLRDFAPGKEQWIAEYANGAHFESRLAHVHGNLFSLLNIVFGLVLLKLRIPDGLAKWASWLALGGLLMPLGILSEVYLGPVPGDRGRDLDLCGHGDAGDRGRQGRNGWLNAPL